GPSLISIKLPPRRSGLKLSCRGALGFSSHAGFFVWLFFLYGYDAHRRHGAADLLPQHFNDSKRASPSPYACNRSDGYGGGTTATATALTGLERRSASKGFLSSHCHCNSGRSKRQSLHTEGIM